MLKIMKTVISISSFAISLTPLLAHSASYFVHVEGMPAPSAVESIKVTLDVIVPGFEYTPGTLAMGPAAPLPANPATTFPWSFSNADPAVAGNQFVVDLFNGDLFDGFFPPGFNKNSKHDQNNLTNGLLFSFLFEGPEPMIAAVEMFGADGFPISVSGARVTGVVPLPGAALLLGSGLVGLVGVRRRFFGG